MRACSAVVIVTAVAMATVAILTTIGWQQPDDVTGGVRREARADREPEVSGSASGERSVPDGLPKEEEQEEKEDLEEAGGRKAPGVDRGEAIPGESKSRKLKSELSVDEKSPETKTLIDLNGYWDISNQNGSISVVGLVPGNVHTALQAAGLIEDPYYRFNDVTYRWIAHDSWTYRRSFTVQDPSIGTKAARVLCHGLDTIAQVFLNGVPVGSSDNQFIGYVFNATGILKDGENVLEVRFQSAVEYARKQFDAHPYLVPPECPPKDYNPECHANFIRKAQCSFSWDWGPAFPTQGIWRPIAIETFEYVAYRSVNVLPYKDAGGWNLNATIDFDLNDALTSVSGLLSFDLAELGSRFETHVTLTRDAASVTVSFPVSGSVMEWWPRGYGEPKLYHVAVNFVPDGSYPVTSVLYTGFREIELVQDTMENGLSFYFKINGVPIFMKGSNWIPMDSFYDRVDYNRLSHLLESVVNANMNSIRVWGGGIYETDAFYEMADQLGILVWQDMMFACSMYPVHEQFLSSVDQEIRYQVKRLGRHPSLMAWTANNENEGALVGNWYGTSGENYKRYKSDYVTLYIDVVRAAILNIDPSRPFLPSSPSNGLVTEENGWVSESPKPGAPEYGDVHYYNYIDDCLNLTLLPRARYSSEYGFQSWPFYETLTEISDPLEDLVYGSEFFYHREHHHAALNGTEEMIRRYFKWPDTGDKHRDFRSYIYLTQIVQALCYQAQTEFYRRGRSDPSVVTMGALYWQHNDIWQAPSWSTIDYNGHWKMAHYFASRFFDDPMVSVVEEEAGVVSVYVISDHLTGTPGVELVVEMRTWTNLFALKDWTYVVDIPAAGAVKVFSRSRSDLLTEGLCESEELCFLNVFLRNSTQPLTSANAFYFVPWNEAQGMQDPNVQVSDVVGIDDSGSRFLVTLWASSVAAFTWVEAVGIPGRFSDNGFLMLQPTLTLAFRTRGVYIMDPDTLRSAIRVTTLHDIYQINR